MTHQATPCIRGCIRRDRHRPECPQEATGADLSALQDVLVPEGGCQGCEPRRASHGLLCRTCHLRLQDWLSDDDERSLVWVHAWLALNLGGTRSVPTDNDRVSGTSDTRTPLHLARHDHRILISDVLSSWVEDVCERYHLQGPARFTVSAGTKFLRAWQQQIEDDADIVAIIWDELSELMSGAHALAPWRAEMVRERTVRCPECDRKAVVRFGGDEVVTCRGCWSVFDWDEWTRWKRQIAFEQQEVV